MSDFLTSSNDKRLSISLHQTWPGVTEPFCLNTGTENRFDHSSEHLHRYLRALRRAGLWTNLVHLN